MLNENIKQYRKNKGFTQETLAQQLGVVRQNVSKWEKGLSVPDAELLQRLAEVLEIGVDDLLGTAVVSEKGNGEIAQQLARINEQLAIKNRRARRIWKTIAIVAVVAVVLNILLVVLAYGAYTFDGVPQEEVAVAESQIIEE